MEKFRFEALTAYLRDALGEDLRWIANYHSRSYRYEFRHVRDDLRDELTEHQLDYVVHRSLAVYNKRHAEEVYVHLGEAGYLLVHYERATAFHLFLDEDRGVTIVFEPDRSIELPDFAEDCRSRIEPA